MTHLALGSQALLLFLSALAGMEAVAWATHRYLMHGPLWVLHRSHHEPRLGWFELNDLFAVFFAAPSIALCAWGRWGWAPALPLGLGMTAYGAIYALFHDGLVHGRFRSPLPLKLMKRLVQAHRLHHAVHTRDGAVSFGFLWASPIRELKAQLRAKQGGAPLTPAPRRGPGRDRPTPSRKRSGGPIATPPAKLRPGL